MSFSSAQFLIFFPVVTALYFALPHRARWLFLLVASCAFYMAFVPIYIAILGFTIVVDYFAGLAIARSDGHRRFVWLVLSLVANIGTLAVFKYYNFFLSNVGWLLAAAGVQAALPFLVMALPIGLSFHTFQAMSYTIEVYRGNQQPERHFGIYALYVMFYPQLVAGPIERPQNLLHQFRERHEFDYDRVKLGLVRMGWGFFKKTVIADRVAVGVNTVYRDAHAFSGPQLILATVLFAIQIYADFSGYSDIAIGAAQVMGFNLMRNFNRPYGAQNITEFWRRWHISLYTWFNDYLYMPLGASVRQWGMFGVVFAVLVTFSVSGLWHGAAWTFVIWGLLHGTAISIETVTRKRRKKWLKPVEAYLRPFAIAITFSFVCFAYIFFRAPSIGSALYIVTHLFSGFRQFIQSAAHAGAIQELVGALGFFRQDVVIAGIAVVVMFVAESLNDRYDLAAFFANRHVAVRWATYYAGIAAIVFFGAYNSAQPFIYFQF